MRGYFGIGVEGISKPMNLGNLLRSAHAFDASFFFTIAPTFQARDVALSDTSDAAQHLPLYNFDSVEELTLPRGCQLVGIEFTEESQELPSFRHPVAAAYVLGPEKGSLSPELSARCEAVVKIPTKFCVNVGVAGAIVMYDRIVSLGRFARRPVNPRARPDPMAEHVRGGQVIRNPSKSPEQTAGGGRSAGE
ncbi:RNA methyltransferase [Ferruginivarius sediminum]|uniref:TrmH family RNA methyltransferase n=1 Tax=Ferruginivarius sediminum TaxID=2661937 RepID=A0A369T5P9_9PROT|nr:RNA methyltransferase [Ferruginivarius sediminum]RDD60232.1 TrmH family RNA methyltransferase [Ferruginivarius sediminum]